MARIQIRRDTSANWTCANPVLYEGELAFETDTKILKIGDGASQYNNVSTLSTPDLIDLTSISVCTNSPNAGGNLSYDNTTGEFAFTPADLSSYAVTGDLSNFICLTDLSICTNTASGNGGLTYNNTTGEFAFTPADLSSIDVTNAICDFICLTDLSICTNTASGNGGLTYNNTTGEFAFTPPDLSSYAVTGALNDFICLTDLSLCTNTASGNGNLSYNNTTGEFAFTPADIDSYFTNGNICNLYMTGTLCGPSTFTIDPAGHGDNTGTVVIAGNLQIDGTTTTINSTTLEVDDVNITLASGSVNAAASDGAGITVDLGSDGNATILYDATNDNWKLNKALHVSADGFNGGSGIFQSTNSGNSITIRGVNGAGINDSAFVLFEDGTASRNAFIGLTGDAAGEGALRFATGGFTERMRIDSSGNVGIGTSSPLAKNHIRGSGTSGQVTASWILENALSGTAGMDITGAAGSSRWRFLRSGGASGTNTMSEAMSIILEGTSAGNVGIGTSSPNAKLDVNGTVKGTLFEGNGSSITNIFHKFTTPTTWSASFTAQNDVTISVSSQFGVPSTAKAILVTGYYHISGYSQGGANQGDHALSMFKENNSWSGSSPWSFTTSSDTGWGCYILEHDGDASGSPHYYGAWGYNGIIPINANGNIYGRLGAGLSGGTHYNTLWCFGYWL
jgi:hypothetical protein